MLVCLLISTNVRVQIIHFSSIYVIQLDKFRVHVELAVISWKSMCNSE